MRSLVPSPRLRGEGQGEGQMPNFATGATPPAALPGIFPTSGEKECGDAAAWPLTRVGR